MNEMLFGFGMGMACGSLLALITHWIIYRDV